jgi:hypothetical protein
MIGPFRGSYAFLSNFHPCRFYWAGRQWPTVEHVYQAAKCETLEDRDKIHQARTPGQAKRLGREVALHPDWDQVKLCVMHDLLLVKFKDPMLRSKLLATGEEELVEVNDWGDTFWGVCRGEGYNYLGNLLMIVRDHYRRAAGMGL